MNTIQTPIPALTDKNLPHLVQAADADVMLSAFRRYFQRKIPAWSGHVLACSIEQIRYKPGRYCRFVYCLRLSQGEKEFEQWFVGALYAGRQRPKITGEQRAPSPHHPWRPVAYWLEMDMSLQAFPFDPGLPQAVRLVDADYVAQLAHHHADKLGFTRDWRCEKVAIHPVKYMPRKRCVLRYELGWRNQGELKNQQIYVKMFNHSKDASFYALLSRIWEKSVGQADALHVPRPLLNLHEENAFWQEAWPGAPLSQLVMGGHWEQYIPRIAHGLAILHQEDFSPLTFKPAPSVDDILENVVGDAEDIGAFFGAARPEITAIVAELLNQQERIANSPTHTAPVHGTFTIGQLLANEDGVAVVDFDSMAQGDPLYDVASFIASILILQTKRDLKGDHLAAVVKSFLHAYACHATWDCDLQRVRWYVAGLLLAKIHALLKSLEIRREGQFRECIEIVSALPAVL